MAVPDRYYGPLFDRIGDSQFGARAGRSGRRVIRAQRGRKTCPKHVLRNPSGTAIPPREDFIHPARFAEIYKSRPLTGLLTDARDNF